MIADDPYESRDINNQLDAELRKLRFSPWQVICLFAGRAVVRSVRIAAGAGIGVIGLLLGELALEILGEPFASLSP